MAHGSRAQKRFRGIVVKYLERYTIHFYGIVALLSLLMIPLSIWVFPSTTLLLTVLILFSAFISAVGDFSSMLIDLHQNDEIDAAQGDIQDLKDDA